MTKTTFVSKTLAQIESEVCATMRLTYPVKQLPDTKGLAYKDWSAEAKKHNASVVKPFRLAVSKAVYAQLQNAWATLPASAIESVETLLSDSMADYLAKFPEVFIHASENNENSYSAFAKSLAHLNLDDTIMRGMYAKACEVSANK